MQPDKRDDTVVPFVQTPAAADLSTRHLTAHIFDPANPNNLEVRVLDQPNAETKANSVYGIVHNGMAKGIVTFQTGPSAANGVNGVTIESLIAIAIDRLQGFQNGPLSDPRNASAIANFQAGLQYLKDRTADRVKRGVDGTLNP